jgi:hypothetical protein
MRRLLIVKQGVNVAMIRCCAAGRGAFTIASLEFEEGVGKA